MDFFWSYNPTIPQQQHNSEMGSRQSKTDPLSRFPETTDTPIFPDAYHPYGFLPRSGYELDLTEGGGHIYLTVCEGEIINVSSPSYDPPRIIGPEDVIIGFPLKEMGLLSNLKELELELDDPENVIARGNNDYDSMFLDCLAKHSELTAIICQKRILLSFLEVKFNNEQTRKQIERILLDFEIVEIKARSARELISKMLPEINSHPVRARANEKWKNELKRHKGEVKQAHQNILMQS